MHAEAIECGVRSRSPRSIVKPDGSIRILPTFEGLTIEESAEDAPEDGDILVTEDRRLDMRSRIHLAKPTIGSLRQRHHSRFSPADELIRVRTFDLQRRFSARIGTLRIEICADRLAMPSRISTGTCATYAIPTPTPRRTTPDRGQSGSTDGLGGPVGNAARRLPRHRRESPRRPRRRTHHSGLINAELPNNAPSRVGPWVRAGDVEVLPSRIRQRLSREDLAVRHRILGGAARGLIR